MPVYAAWTNEIEEAPSIPPICVDLESLFSQVPGGTSAINTHLMIGSENEFSWQVQANDLAFCVLNGNTFNLLLAKLPGASRFEGNPQLGWRKPLAQQD